MDTSYSRKLFPHACDICGKDYDDSYKVCKKCVSELVEKKRREDARRTSGENR